MAADLNAETIILSGSLTRPSLDVEGNMGVTGELTLGTPTDGEYKVGEHVIELTDKSSDHKSDSVVHLTGQERTNFNNITSRFSFDNTGKLTPTATVPPRLPAGSYSWQFFNDFFANRAEKGVYEAPGKVYISRVPYPQKVDGSANFDSTYLCSSISAIPANTPIAKFDKAKLEDKLMDNAGLNHTYATDTNPGVDDYVGKQWAFWWGHANYITDEDGNKHITAVKDLPKTGRVFSGDKNVCAFGPKFWYFVKTELYKFTDSNGEERWTTDDGTETGQPITQLWGISDSPWDKLSDEKRLELYSHGITSEDMRIWPECLVYDSTLDTYIERPYWCHSAYFAGAENEAGTGPIVSKPNLPLRRNNLSYNHLNAAYGAAVGGVYPSINRGGTAACITGFPILFDIIKTADKNTQKYHSGMSSNYSNDQNVTDNLTYKAVPTYNTSAADYIFPIGTADQTVAQAMKQFEKHCTVYLESVMYVDSTKAKYRGISRVPNGRSAKTQIGRISAVELRTFDTVDAGTVTAPCIVLDATTVEQFLVRTTEEACAELQAAGVRACCYVQQGFSISGETDAVLGKTDGACTNLTNGRHPFRVQGTEYMVGAWTVASDMIAIRDDGTTPIEINGEYYTNEPGVERYMILNCPAHAKRINNGAGVVSNWINAGYKVQTMCPITEGYVAQGTLSESGGFVTLSVGQGASSGNSFGDYYYRGGNKGVYEYLSGGRLYDGPSAGSAFLYLDGGLGSANWNVCARD